MLLALGIFEYQDSETPSKIVFHLFFLFNQKCVDWVLVEKSQTCNFGEYEFKYQTMSVLLAIFLLDGSSRYEHHRWFVMASSLASIKLSFNTW